MSEHGAEDNWVDGSYESGADEPQASEQTAGSAGTANPETGVGLGAGEPSTFEPEEDEPSAGTPG
jgi:hypothetical protein